MSNAHVTRYMNEVILYAGLPFRRGDVERDLDRLGVTGPARLSNGRKPAVDMEPLPIEILDELCA